MEPENTTICKRCQHVELSDDPLYAIDPDYWRCGATKTEVPNYVTGKPKAEMKMCQHKNMDGNCPDYKPVPPREPSAKIRHPRKRRRHGISPFSEH